MLHHHHAHTYVRTNRDRHMFYTHIISIDTTNNTLDSMNGISSMPKEKLAQKIQ